MIYKATDNLYRGARLQESDIEKLKELGINCIINLEEKEESSILIDKGICKVLDAEFYNFPMSEFKRPYTGNLWLYSQDIYSKLSRGRIVYIHCKHGQDRTGFVIASYRMIVQGWSFKDAYQECLDYGHKAWFYDYFPLFWKKSLLEIAEKYEHISTTKTLTTT